MTRAQSYTALATPELRGGSSNEEQSIMVRSGTLRAHWASLTSQQLKLALVFVFKTLSALDRVTRKVKLPQTSIFIFFKFDWKELLNKMLQLHKRKVMRVTLEIANLFLY